LGHRAAAGSSLRATPAPEQFRIESRIAISMSAAWRRQGAAQEQRAGWRSTLAASTRAESLR
jgi:hypothetical protein